MENEEKEDLLLKVTESEEEEACEKEEIDYRVLEEKIFDFNQREKLIPNESSRKKLIFSSCFFMFLASLVLVVVLPIYVKYSSLGNISTYSKLLTVSLANAISFGITHVIGIIAKCDFQFSPNQSISFRDVLKVSLFLSIGSMAIFWLIDGNFISCHLEDPLKGCSIVFSLFFYFLFSTKKMSVEKTFCAITIIVGVFVSVDFGLCDRFHCKGSSVVNEVVPKLHFLYIFLYLLFHGVWVLYFTFIESCWTSFKDSNSSSNELSIVPNIFGNDNSHLEKLKRFIPSLSAINVVDGNQDLTLKNENSGKSKKNKKSNSNCQSNNNNNNNNNFLHAIQLDNTPCNSVPCISQLSAFNINKFPVTSTPKNDVSESWSPNCCHDVALWSHMACLIAIVSFCWIETVPFLNSGKGKLLSDVISEILDSFLCHIGWKNNPNCNYLPIATVIFSASYVTLILSSLELMKSVQSTVTVVAVMMPALPLSNLFWSFFHFNENVPGFLDFSPEISGEAVCAVLGLPIIGIGIVLLLKSHIREVNLVM